MATIANTASGTLTANSLNTLTVNTGTSGLVYTVPSIGDNTSTSLYFYGGDSSMDYNAREIIRNENYSETTIRSIIMDMKNAGKADNFDFNYILSVRTLSERFLDDFYDKFNQVTLYRTQTVSLDFIKRHLKEIKQDAEVCKAISLSQPLTESFIESFIDHIDWASIAANTKIKFTVSFLLAHIDKFDDSALKALCVNDSIGTGVFNALLKDIPDDIRFNLDWAAISWHKDLTEENIVNNIDFIDFNSLLLCTRKFKDDVITCFRKVKFGI